LQVVNLVASDASRLQWSIPFIHWLPAGVVQIALAIVLLYRLIGWLRRGHLFSLFLTILFYMDNSSRKNKL
jgi:hypothetical protein